MEIWLTSKSKSFGHRQARLPALLRGQRSHQRQGLRERGRLRDRRPARLPQVQGGLDGRAVQRLLRAWAEGLRLRRQPDLDHPGPLEQVDFSAPYYTANQAVVALKDSDAAKATSLGDLKETTIGVQVGTTSFDAVNEVIDPSTDPKVFDNSNDVVNALKNGQVDAVVVDVPTALYVTAVQVPDSTVVGQFPAPGGDRWGALLSKGSPLTACVSKAVVACAPRASCRRSPTAG